MKRLYRNFIRYSAVSIAAASFASSAPRSRIPTGMAPVVPTDATSSSCAIGAVSCLIKIPETYRPFPTVYADQLTSAPSEGARLSLLDAKAAKSIDEDLMSPSGGFSLDQLMELAGLSVASAALEVMSHHGRQGRRVLVLCGPGNNGGDGLVAARHLSHFGYNPEIYFPDKRPKFPGLIMQCENLNIPTLSALPSLDDYDLVIDAVFGFSFKGPLRSEYRPAISAMAASRSPVLAVDIPSGWDVEKGDVFETGFRPAAVVSLTAPKMCLSDYTGLHYVGGRFVPPAIQKKYGIAGLDYGAGAQQIFSAPLSAPSAAAGEGAASSWQLHVSPEGYLYYYNAASGQSEWARFEGPINPSLLPPKEQCVDKAVGEPIVTVMITFPNRDLAEGVARHLVSERLAACAQLMNGLTSFYVWQGVAEESTEVIMIVKTRKALLDELTVAVKEKHTYEVPEVVASDVVGGNPDYLKWVIESTKEPGSI